MDGKMKNPKLEKQALTQIGKLKAQISKVEGLFTGFKHNLE